jgi:hypothetical protein
MQPVVARLDIIAAAVRSIDRKTGGNGGGGSATPQVAVATR